MHLQKRFTTVNVRIWAGTCLCLQKSNHQLQRKLLIAGDFNLPDIAWKDGFPYRIFIQPKIFWNYVSSKDCNRRNIKRLERENNSEAADLEEIGELLNQQFASFFTSAPDGELPPAPQSNATNQMTELIVEKPQY